MEAQENEITSGAKIHSEEKSHMEMSEEKVCSLWKIHLERFVSQRLISLVEASEEEKVPSQSKFSSERSRLMEAQKKETSWHL